MFSERVYKLLEIAKGAMLEDKYAGIPLKVFNDNEIFELELRNVFAKSWMFLGFESEIPNVGDYVLRYIGIDPFIVVRGEDNKIRAFLNVCRHKGNLLIRDEKGNARFFQCPYHGWTYNSKGNLIGVPFREKGFRNLSLEEWGLIEARVKTYEGLIFATVNSKAPSLEDYLGDAKWYLDIIVKATGGLEVIGPPHKWIADINWKSDVDNFGDSLHPFYTHKVIGDLGLIDTRKNRFSNSRTVSRTEFLIIDIKDRNNLPVSWLIYRMDPSLDDVYFSFPPEIVKTFNPSSVSEEQWNIFRKGAAMIFSIYPNLNIIIEGFTKLGSKDPYLPVLFFRQTNPLAPDKSVIWRWYPVPKGTPEDLRLKLADLARSTFSSTGVIEQDDVFMWRGQTKAARGVMAENVILNYQFGSVGVGDVNVIADSKWPGTVLNTNLSDMGLKTFWKRWVLDMLGDGHE
ncbi:aromatic ring-hydroxylating dioxygenase subunit alpha [Sulfolobus tengchongensis]|uniref:Aromatic ring-hydroxylating dioxygenase subunit alpha n=1 Tax=Sulfolobus tengchongensis TaxID=207809 RepID=A0AAX4L2A6_9CREN